MDSEEQGESFTIAVGNPGTIATTVRVEGSTGVLDQKNVLPGKVGIFTFDRSRRMEGTTRLPNAYRVVSDLPVAAYQVNPTEAADLPSQDGSRLLPLEVLGAVYRPVGRQTMAGAVQGSILPGTVAIVGISYETTAVTVIPRGAIRAGFLPGVQAGVPVSFPLQRFEVAHLETEGIGQDLTGSLISTDRPVAVFGGSKCSYIPETSRACDHLEEQMLPVARWGKDFLAVKSVERNKPGDPVEEDFWRIVSSADGTTIVFQPDVTGVGPVTLASAGDFIEVATTQDFRIVANEPVQVAQYFRGMNSGFQVLRSGDPSMLLVTPTEFFDADFLFWSPASCDEDYVTIVAPAGASVTLDGGPVSPAAFFPIGATGFGRARLPLGDGTHRVASTAPSAVYVYGYRAIYNSYGYPAGGKPAVVNSAILCDAGGPYQVGCRGGTIRLDGSGSSGPGALSLAWSSFTPGIAFSPPDASVTDATFPPAGPHVVALTVTNGTDAATCYATVEVADLEPPALSCPGEIVSDPTRQGGADVVVLASVTDDCDSSPSVTNDRTSRGVDASDFYPCGRTTVRFTAVDDSGKSAECLTIVTVNDPPPIVTCPARIETVADRQGGAVVTVRATVSDPCEETPSLQNDRTGTGGDATGFYPCGETIVVFTASDSQGQTDTCSTVVAVADAPPNLTCPPLVTGIQPDGSGVVLPVIASVTDFCDSAPAVSNDRTPGGLDATDVYVCGETFVTYTARNASGLEATCRTRVVVTDAAGPQVFCPPLIEAVPTEPGAAQVTVTAMVEDACDPTPFLTNDRTGGGGDASGPYPCGETVVTFTATNASGQTATCATRVRVMDSALPAEVAGPGAPSDLLLRARKDPPSQPVEIQLLFEDRGAVNEAYNLYQGTLLPTGIVAYDYLPVICGVPIRPAGPGRGMLSAPFDEGVSRYYLVSASNCLGEGPRGRDSRGVEHPALPADCGPLP